MHAPLRASAHRGRIAEVAADYFDNRTHACELFRRLYGGICLAMHDGRAPAGMGAASHIQETFEWLSTPECYNKNFALAKLGRFHDFVEKVGRTQK